MATKTTNTTVVKTVVALLVCNAKVSEDKSLSLDHLANTTLGSESVINSENIGGVYINGKKRRSVALETITLTVFNDSCLNMPIHERGIGALLDTGTQRTMITSETVDKLGFKVVEREAATL